MEIHDQYVPISRWSNQDKPREKLLNGGPKSLSDSELLAILIGSGSKNESAISLSTRILTAVGHNLQKLAKLKINDLTKFKGIGQVKAVNILTALELGRRREFSTRENAIQIKCSHDAYISIASQLADLQFEEFWILLLNRNNRIIQKKKISTGGVSGTVVDPKVVFNMALKCLASSIILCHNHPSGNLSPSIADQKLTRKLIDAGKTLDIKIMDHLIIGENKYFSFADDGRM